MRKIEGFHTLWTAPYFKQNTEDTYSMQDYELLTMILSALMWRKMNGPITLYGDERAIDYVERQGIAHIWHKRDRGARSRVAPGVLGCG